MSFAIGLGLGVYEDLELLVGFVRCKSGDDALGWGSAGLINLRGIGAQGLISELVL